MALLKTIFFLLLFTISNLAVAGAWPQPRGSYFLKLSEWWIVSDQHFNDMGIVTPNTHEFGYYATNLYAEYGFSNRLSGIFHFPLINFTYSVPPSMIGKLSAWSLGDAELSIKYALTHQKSMAVSMKLLMGIPIGKEGGELSGGLQTGDGEWNQGLVLDAGTAFKISSSDGWINLSAGYNLRTKGFSDELLYGVEGGIKLSNNNIMIIARMIGIKSIGSSTILANPQSLFSNNREYLSLSPEIIYQLKDSWGITAGIGTAFSGRNIFANTTFTLGIFKKKKEYSG